MPCHYDHKRMTTGVAAVDDQHRHLFDLVNGLADMKGRPDVSKAQVDALLGELVAYAGSHFAYEEAEMARVSCPNAEVNKLAHMRFTKKIGEWVETWKKSQDLKLIDEMCEFFGQWLSSHICVIDTRLRSCGPKP